MAIKENSVVSIHYTLTDDDGVQIDSSQGADPLVYLHGAGNIIPGLENALSGKAVGDELKVTIAPADAYGEYQDAMVQSVPRELFGDNQDMQPGMRFQAQTDNGPISVVVTEVTDETVSVDANHPLAGKTLHFDVTVAELRDATEEELAHGHPHVAGGCGHDH
ncbi:peptidylprolyl isomerase [Porticoccaceae bacterium LTM1]|nr:peptidylprolyl isomerase [Porticoccaceae bacterium LTM1]